MSLIKGIISGIVGASLFLIFLFILDIGLLFSIIAGIVSFGASLLIFHSLSSKTIEMEIDSVHDEYYQNILNEGYGKLQSIKAEVKNMKNQDIQKDGMDILDICENIFKNLEEKPKDITVIRQFFTYYLDAVQTIFQKYNSIANRGLSGEKKVQLDEQMTGNLTMVKELFHSKLKKLLENDVVDLDVELQTLTKMMEMEGIRS